MSRAVTVQGNLYELPLVALLERVVLTNKRIFMPRMGDGRPASAIGGPATIIGIDLIKPPHQLLRIVLDALPKRSFTCGVIDVRPMDAIERLGDLAREKE